MGRDRRSRDRSHRWIGAVILVRFVVGNLVREWVLGHWVDGAALTTLGMCVTAGVLTGE